MENDSLKNNGPAEAPRATAGDFSRPLGSALVERFISTKEGPIKVKAELASWMGIPLMLHEVIEQNGIWKCSHEPSGHGVATGYTAEDALSLAVQTLRKHWDSLPERFKKAGVINSPNSKINKPSSFNQS